ncbi:unnamed protein product [Hydatigera taeniaeformis]|uniref:Protein zer-1 homolog-like C-terminal domain-containing protein n=1 Tax=Hydatigena taeniaeformis TaxID=6205 RepID=A0A3P7EX22_HYDTA|nr:unnamed protein product [Hydatigera taeniaeformis]
MMDFFNKMLSHSSIQISYFAAGIVSHLACLPDEVWISALQYNKSEFIRVLVSCSRLPVLTTYLKHESLLKVSRPPLLFPF